METATSKVALLVLLLFPILINAQTDYSKPFNNEQNKSVLIDSNEYATFKKIDGKRVISFHNPTTTASQNDTSERYIVQFKGIALASCVNNNSKMHQAKMVQEETFAKFRKDFKSTIKKAKTTTKQDNAIRYEYGLSYFGTSVVATKTVIKELRQLTYVKAIHKVTPVEANLHNSVPLIGADSVWINLGYTGEGIKIGIIDTGIDYNHPALGGGFGNGYKVAGGYDFAGMDADPIDDYGHGTHVAGIAAGNGEEIVGVAPNATLYALKALNAGGSGYADDIIAAIEWCADPNQDGNFSDRMDIVNMSLGGSGNSNDAMSTAVDNVSAMGVVFCISAGNSGQYGKYTIGSPGTAQSAITVGATDNKDNRAYFSSIGPSEGSYAIKPEVMAPGVDIYSAGPNNKYFRASGTSMAAPMVAGLCALLKQAHPTWQSAEMKSALMTTAKNLDLSPYQQGAGRIQAMEAIQAKTLIIPAHLSFGKCNPTENIITKYDTLCIINNDSVLKQYQLVFDSSINGITLLAGTDDFSLAPADSISIPISIGINKNELNAHYDTVPEIYGSVLLLSNNDTINIPWGVSQVKELHIKINEDWETLYIIGNDMDLSFDFLNDSISNISLPIGCYSFFQPLGIEWILKKDLDISTLDTLDLSTTLAKNEITAKPKDENGNEINQYQAYVFSMEFDNINIAMDYTSLDQTIYINDQDSTVQLGYCGISTPDYNENVYLFSAYKNGITQSTQFENDYMDFEEINLNIQTPRAQYLDFYLYAGSTFYVGTPWKKFNILKSNWKGSVFIPKTESFIKPYLSYSTSGRGYSQRLRVLNDSLHTYQSNSYDPGNMAFHYDSYDSKYKYVESINRPYLASDGPTKLAICTENNRIEYDETVLIESYIYHSGQNGEFHSTLNAGSTLILKDSSGQVIYETHESSWGFTKEVALGVYSVEYNFVPSYEDFINASAHTIANFDLRKEDKTSPIISSLQIRNSNNAPTNLIYKNEDAKIRFSIADIYRYDSITVSEDIADYTEKYVGYKPVALDSIKLYIKRSDQTIWDTLSFNQLSEDHLIGNYLESDISSYTASDSAIYDIKIYAADPAGNNCIGTWSNCFFVNKCDGVVAHDDYYYTTEEEKIIVPTEEGILANDALGFEYFGAYYTIVKTASNGKYNKITDGSFNYKPYEGFVGTDTVIYTLQNRFGEPDTASVYIVVDSALVDIPEIAQGQGINCHPNPFANEVKISINAKAIEKGSLQIFNSKGQMVLLKSIAINQTGINDFQWNGTSNQGLKIEEGIYFIQIITPSQSYQTKVMLMH